jgi:hypothetical protein
MTSMDKLLFLASYWDKNRQVGHTTAILNGVRDTPDSVVITATEHEHKMMQSVGLRKSTPTHILPHVITVSIDRLDSLMRQNGPLVVDHHAMSVMIKDAVREMRREIELAKERYDVA